MKNFSFFTLLAIFLFCAIKSSGQAVITHGNHAPYIGYSATHMIQDDSLDPLEVDPGQPGPNQTWDFSELIGDREEVTTFIDPGNTPFADSIAGTDINIATEIEDEGDESYGFMKIDTDEFVYKAFGVMEEGEPAFFTMYNPSPTVMVYPFAYNDFLSTYGELEITDDGMIIVQKSWITSEADAWGTIITPLETHNNTLRIKSTSTDSILIYMGGSLIHEEAYVDVDYSWFSENHRMQVFSIHGEFDNEFIPSHLSYLVSETVGIAERNILSMNVYPNPASEYIFIQHPGKYSNLMITLNDLTGKQIFNTQVPTDQQIIQLDVSNYPNGVYFLKLYNSRHLIGSDKIIIQR